MCARYCNAYARFTALDQLRNALGRLSTPLAEARSTLHEYGWSNGYRSDPPKAPVAAADHRSWSAASFGKLQPRRVWSPTEQTPSERASRSPPPARSAYASARGAGAHATRAAVSDAFAQAGAELLDLYSSSPWHSSMGLAGTGHGEGNGHGGYIADTEAATGNAGGGGRTGAALEYTAAAKQLDERLDGISL